MKSKPEERDDAARRLFGRVGDLPVFFAFCDDLLCQENDFLLRLNNQNAGDQLTYKNILHVVDILKHNPQMTKNETFQSLCEGASFSSRIEKIINLAVQAMVMIDCAANRHHATDFNLGGHRPISWLSQEKYVDFVERSFPVGCELSMKRADETVEDKASMKAWKLQKRLGISFRGTDNLAEHLLFDPKSNCLYLFHHAKFLKAHLENCRSHNRPLGMSLLESLKVGTVPPQLLVETLHSIQSILFPPIDPKSASILDKLISKRGGYFDRECAEYEGYQIFQEPPEDFKYIYWGERLAILRELLKNRPPRNKLERWLRWQTSESNALFVALLALLISICVGIISIVLACVQIWIGWMAWKHPVGQG